MEPFSDLPPEPLEPFTRRECEILLLMAQNHSNYEIADQLFLSLNTIKWYIKRLYGKLEVHTRSEAVKRAAVLNLLSADPAAEASLSGFPSRLPAWTTRFVGREHELNDLTRLVWNEQVRLVTLLAIGGMGKTRLALACAESWQDRFRDGVFFVPLTSLTLPDQLLFAIAGRIGCVFQADKRPPKRQLLDFLSGKNVLLMLDNFEHLLESSPVVSEILEAAPEVRVLVTSRERLNLVAESVFTLSGLNYPTQNGDNLFSYAAIRLFLQTARRVQPNFIPDDPNSVMRLCQLVQGMPLAIELAASHIRLLSTGDIVSEIERSLDFLGVTARDLPERLRSIRAVFEWSWGRLTAEEQAVFRRWAVFRGSPAREAVTVVTGASLPTLSSLVDKALLWRNPLTHRFETHELLRQAAEEKLEQAGEVASIRARFSRFYLSLLQARQTHFQDSRQIDAVAEIRHDIPNILQALQWAVQERNYALLNPVLHSLWLYYHISGQLQDGWTVFSEVGTTLQESQPDPRSKGVLGALLAYQARLCVELGHHDMADWLADQSQPLLDHSGTDDDRAFLALTRGWRNMLAWRATEAIRPHFQRALALYQKSGNMWGTALALYGMGGSCFGRLGVDEPNLDEARLFTEQALAIQQTLGDVHHLARTFKQLGMIADQAREYDRGEQWTLESLRLNQLLGNRLRQAGDLNNLAVSALNQCEFDKAIRYGQESLTIYRNSGKAEGILQALGNLAGTYRRAGQYVQAHAYAAEGVALARGTEHTNWLINCLLTLGWCARAFGAYDEARQHFAQVVQIGASSNEPQDMIEGLIQVTAVALEQRNLSDAQQMLAQADKMAREADYAPGLACVHELMGNLAYVEGEIVQARELLERSLSYFESGAAQRLLSEYEQNEHLVTNFLLLAKVELAAGQADAAHNDYRKALTVAWQTNNIPAVLRVLSAIAEELQAHSRHESTAGLAAVVAYHPATYAVDKKRMRDLLENHFPQIPAQAVTVSGQHQNQMQLASLVTSLLAQDR